MIHLISYAYPEDALKKDLWDVIKKSRTPPIYAVNKIAKAKGKFKLHAMLSKMCITRW